MRFLCAVAVALPLSGVPAWALLLAERGSPGAAVVIDQEPAPCVPFAAEEFRQHIREMSGATLPLVEVGPEDSIASVGRGRATVLIGESGLTRELGVECGGLAPDGFVIKSFPHCLVICGNDADRFGVNYDRVPASAGTLYGVYRVLAALGVRWFYPGEAGTVIPSRAKVEVPDLDLRDAPYFPYRFGGYGKELMTWYRRIGFGGDRDPWSTRHTFNQTIRFWDKYGADHPEYFASGRDGTPGRGIALGHPEVIAPIVAEAREFLGSDRPAGKKYFLVIPADGRGHCWCERCMKKLDFERDPRGEMSNIVAEAAVKVALAVRDEFPQGRIVYCAYSNYYLPPTNVERFPENVALLIAQPRSGFHDEERRAEAEQVLREWISLKPTAVYFCRYYGSLQTMVPSLMPGIIARDIKTLKAIDEDSDVPLGGEMNFTGLPADSPHSWWHHLNSYLTAKLLWDPGADVEALIDDYCERFYGPGAEPMRQFWDRCAELYQDDGERELYAVDTINELERLIEAAREATEGTEHAARLEFIDRGFNNLRMIRAKLRSVEEAMATALGEGLVLHYSFDDPLDQADPTVKDQAGEHDGRAAGAASVEGVRGRALSLTGEASGVKILACSLAGTDYSLSAWIKPSRPLFEGTHNIFGPHGYHRHCLRVDGGRLWLWHRTKDGSWGGQRLSCAGPEQGFVPGRWYHVVGTFSQKSGLALYIDGQLRALDVTKTEPSVHPVANIGARGFDDFQDCFPGTIDEARIYRRELSGAEVKRLYEERR